MTLKIHTNSRKRSSFGYCLILIILCLNLGSHFTLEAQPSANLDYNPGRPGTTTGSGILIPNTLSIETGFPIKMGIASDEESSWNNYYCIRYAPINILELYTSFSYGSPIISGNGTENLKFETWSAGAKVNILKKKDMGMPGIALFASISVPLYASLERHYPTPGLAIFIDHAWNNFSLAYNIGFEGFNQLYYNVYGDYTIIPRLSIFAEFLGWHTFEDGILDPIPNLNAIHSSYGSLQYQMGLSVFILNGLKADFTIGTEFLNITGVDKTANAIAECRSLFFEVGLAYGIPLKRENK